MSFEEKIPHFMPTKIDSFHFFLMSYKSKVASYIVLKRKYDLSFLAINLSSTIIILQCTSARSVRRVLNRSSG